MADHTINSISQIEKERQRLAEKYLAQSGDAWPTKKQLVVHLGPDAYNCELVIICGKLTHIANYDWYMSLALEELGRIACYQSEERYGHLKYKTVDYDFVWRYRHAIRENYNHGHNIPASGFSSLRQVKKFIQAIETVEELSMRMAVG